MNWPTFDNNNITISPDTSIHCVVFPIPTSVGPIYYDIYYIIFSAVRNPLKAGVRDGIMFNAVIVYYIIKELTFVRSQHERIIFLYHCVPNPSHSLTLSLFPLTLISRRLTLSPSLFLDQMCAYTSPTAHTRSIIQYYNIIYVRPIRNILQL